MPSSKTRNRFLAVFLTLLCTGLAAQGWSEDVIYTAVYKGEYSGWRLEMTRRLIQTSEREYTLNSYAHNMFANIDESSIFSVDNSHIWPQHYTYKRRVFGKSNEEKLDFNWLNKTASYQRSGRKENAIIALKPGLLDPALYQLMMQKELAGGQQQFNYDFVKRKDLKHYSFKVTGKEKFTLNNTSYEAVVVERQDGSTTRKTRVWLLPALDSQIARIQQKEESGDTYAIELASYSADEKKLKQFYATLR